MKLSIISIIFLLACSGPSITDNIIAETGGNIGINNDAGTTGGNTSMSSSKANQSTGGNSITPTNTGGSLTSNTGTGGDNTGTDGTNSTGGNSVIDYNNYAPSPLKATVQGNGTCTNINLPDYATAVQIAPTPQTGPCNSKMTQDLYGYINGTASSAMINCIINPGSCATNYTACWQCMINSHALVGGTAGYWFNYTMHYSTNACSKFVWLADDCYQQACNDSTTQKDYANCVINTQLPTTPNVPKSGLCYEVYSAANVAIYNEVTISEIDVTLETSWEYYTEVLCGT